MGRILNGYDDGSNGGVVSSITYGVGWGDLHLKLPAVVRVGTMWGGILTMTGELADLHDGFIASKQNDKEKVSRFTCVVAITGSGVDVRHRFRQREVQIPFPLPRGFIGTVTVSLTVEKEQNSYYDHREKLTREWWDFEPVFAYSTFQATFDNAALATEVDQKDVLELSELAVPNGATALEIKSLYAQGMVGKLIDRIELEIPARQFLPQLLLLCTFQEPDGNSPGMSTCRYLERDSLAPRSSWVCKPRRITCSGARSDCSLYSPFKKCQFIRARELFNYNSADGTLTIDNNGIAKCFDTKDGMGFVPYGAWRGAKDDMLDLFGNLFDALNHGASYYCHKFESQAAHPQLLPCHASQAGVMPWQIVGSQTLWRYVNADNSLDLTCSAGTHTELVLKTEDIPLVNYQDFPGEATAKATGGVWYTGNPSLAPAAYLPKDLPPGQYGVWAYMKNTTGLGSALCLQVNAQNSVGGTDLLGASQEAFCAIPAAPAYAWVQLHAALPLQPFARLTFGMQRTTVPSGAFDAGGEFAVRSIYLERV